MNRIEGEYFEWLYQYVGAKRFRKLLSILHSTTFVGLVHFDENRIYDGVSLRYNFLDDVGYSNDRIEDFHYECTVLEMMVALSIRMERDILCDEDFGDRTAMWFWMMIKSLGLFEQDDVRIDREYVYDVLDRFINREYEPDGRGGLFTLGDDYGDVRDIEIWAQMNIFCVRIS